jgi:hypothetical protein
MVITGLYILLVFPLLFTVTLIKDQYKNKLINALPDKHVLLDHVAHHSTTKYLHMNQQMIVIFHDTKPFTNFTILS